MGHVLKLNIRWECKTIYIADALGQRANLLLIRKNEIVGVDQLKDQDSKFLGYV